MTTNLESCTLFIASWLSLLCDSPIGPNSKPFRLYKNFYKKLCSDLKGTVVRFTNIAHDIVKNHYIMGTDSSTGIWVDEIKDTPVFFEYNRYFHVGDIQLIQYIYTFLNFGKKLEYTDDEFNETALRGWLDVERRLNDLDLPWTTTNNIATILKETLPTLSDSDFWPKHGPGAVSERVGNSVNNKHKLIAYDTLLDRFLFHGQAGMFAMGEDHGLTPQKVIPDPSMWDPAHVRPRPPAKLRFVPKNLKTARTICMEPATLMYFQQGVMRQMIEAMENSPFSKFIRLRDQSRNQELCAFGSYTGSIDTLDLSAASDSLSYELVRRCFPASWLIRMETTRSSTVELPNGDIVSVKKFAPMGSALCFPTQCLIFASVCIYATFLHKIGAAIDSDRLMSATDVANTIDSINNNTIKYSAASGRYQPLAIYGDDICCDSNITAHVKSILMRLGFSVNNEKSFVGSQAFRESCGKYYLDGNDVTPLYYTVKDVRRKLTPNHIASHVHLINECGRRGFQHLRSFLIHLIKEWPAPKKFGGFSVPFVPPFSTNFGIEAQTQVNSHLESRESIPLQRTEWKCWTISSVRREPWTFAHDSYLHMRWWASKRCHESDTPNGVSGHRPAVGYSIQRRWTPLY